ncbi:MAG: hypothetical protein ACLFSV_05635 [Alkalispirochaeta sp.]
MHPVVRRWEQFSRRYSRRRWGVMTALTAYPATIGAAAITFAVVVGGDAPSLDLPRVLITDGFLSGVIIFTGVIAVAPLRRTRRSERRWFAFAAELSGALASGSSLLSALLTSAHRVFDDDYAVSRRIEEWIIEGSPPGIVLAELGCPAALVDAIGRCERTDEVETTLIAEIDRYQAAAIGRLDRLERAGRPVATAIAGATVVWLVVRIVIPLFIDRFSGAGSA